jgi:hypothetical protein
VVPGITSANGAASYAGIPLTHRDHAQSVTFVTGHKKDGSIDLDWPALTRPDQTVVVYMGLTMAADLCGLHRAWQAGRYAGGGHRMGHHHAPAHADRNASEPAGTDFFLWRCVASAYHCGQRRHAGR